MPKNASSKKDLNDTDAVNDYMEKLEHPLKNEIEMVRSIIKASSTKIKERIKWNAPSFFTTADLVTFNHRNIKQVHLVFHHEAIVNIHSEWLLGDYKDRRMMYFDDMNDIKKKEKVLSQIMKSLISLAE